MKIIKRWASIGKIQLARLIEGIKPEFPVVVAIFFKSNTKRRDLKLVSTSNASIFIGVLSYDDVVIVAKEKGLAQYMVWKGEPKKFLKDLRNTTYATHATSMIYTSFGKNYYKRVRGCFSGIVSAFESVGVENIYQHLISN